MDSSEDENLITPEIIEEWESISGSQELMIEWQHRCRATERKFFIDYLEKFMRRLIAAVVAEIGGVVVVNPGVVRTLGYVLDRCVMMGFFVGTRRFHNSIAALDHDLAPAGKEPEKGPDTGGLRGQDFSL